jgi:hypothetical protein
MSSSEQSRVHSDRQELQDVMSASQVRAQVNRIQEIMRDVMKVDTHFGTIPGTPKPSLWKAGAEKLCMTFRIGIENVIDADLSTADVVRYRIRAIATSQASGIVLGTAMGECSSDEEKYRWRKAVCNDEFNETAEDRRRRKWKKGYGGGSPTAENQVRTEPADIANTVLKMAAKRAQIAVVLQVTAASDIFTQDLEDLPEGVREQVVGSEKSEPKTTEGKPSESTGTSGNQPEQSGPVISEQQAKRAYAIAAKDCGFTTEQYRAAVKAAGFESDRDIPKSKYDAFVDSFKKVAQR